MTSRRRAAMIALALLAAVLVINSGPRPAVAQDALRIAAVVNDDVISVHDLATRIALLLATTGQQNTPEARQRAAPHVLRMLIDEKLKMQEAKRLAVQVTRAEIDRALNQIAGQIGVSPADLPRLLANNGVTISALMEQVEAEIAWVKAVSQSAQAQRNISDEEVDARIERINQAAGRPEFRIAEIVLPVDDPSNEAEIQALGRRIMDQLRQGVGFPALARNYSEAASAAVGGDLGWIGPEQLSPELQAAVRELSPGEVLGPIRTLTGYTIVLLIEKRTSQGIAAGVGSGGMAALAGGGSAEAGTEADARAEMEADGEPGPDVGSDASDTERPGVPPFDDESGEDVGESGVGAGEDGSGRRPLAPASVREQVRDMLMNERMEANARRMLRNLRREAFVDLRL